MRQFKVRMHNTVSGTLTVELDEETLAQIATELEKDVAELTTEDLREIVIDRSYAEGMPGLCFQCVGWSREWSREEDDDWQVDDDDDAVEEVTDASQ